MLTTQQVTKIMGCGRHRASKKLKMAGVKYDMKAFPNGKKTYWRITEEGIRAIMAEEDKTPEEIALQKTAALSALEAVFNQKRRMQ